MFNGTVSVIQGGANARQEQAAGNAAQAKEGSFPERRREDRCGGMARRSLSWFRTCPGYILSSDPHERLLGRHSYLTVLL
jgi:hypothetical protein